MDERVISRRAFVATGVGAAVTLAGIKFPGLASAAPAAGNEALAERLVEACAPAYRIDKTPQELIDGMRRYVAASGESAAAVLDRLAPELVAYDDGVLASSDAPDALRALNRSVSVGESWDYLLQAGLNSERTLAEVPAEKQRPLRLKEAERSEADDRTWTILAGTSRLMTLAAAGAGVELRDLELVGG